MTPKTTTNRCWLAFCLVAACGSEGHEIGGSTEGPAPRPIEPSAEDNSIEPDPYVREGSPIGEMLEWAQPGESPRLDVDELGNAIIAWQATRAVFAVRYTAGEGFSGRTLLAGEALPTSSWGSVIRSVAAGAARAAVVYGAEQRGHGSDGQPLAYDLMARAFDPAVGWMVEGWVSQSVLGPTQDPRLLILDSGRTIAAWHERDDSLIHANVHAPELGWGTAGVIDDGPRDVNTSPPVMVAAEDGGARIAWRKFRQDGHFIQASSYRPGIGFTGLAGARDPGLPNISPGVHGCVNAVTRDTSGQLSFYRLLCDDPTSEEPVAPAYLFFAVAANGVGGEPVVIWDTPVDDRCGGDLWASSRTNLGWSDPVLIETSVLGSPPSIVADNGSGVVAIAGAGYRIDDEFIEGDCFVTSFWVRKLGSPAREELDSIESPGRLSDLTIDVDPNGRIFAAWTRTESSGGVTVHVRIVE